MEEVFTVEKMPPVTSEDLENFHCTAETKASKILSTFLDTNSQRFKHPIQVEANARETLQGFIYETFAHFKTLARKKVENVRAEALKETAKAEKEFAKEMEKLLTRAQDEQEFNSQASFYKGQAQSRFEASIDPSAKGKQIFQDILSEWDAKVEKLLSHYKIEMRKKHQVKVENLKARSNLTKFEEDLRAELGKILRNITDEQTFDYKASSLQNRLTTNLRNSMDVSIMGIQSVQEIMSSWNSRAQELLHQCRVTVKNQIQQRLERAKAQAHRDLVRVEEEFTAELEKLVENRIADEQTFNFKASSLENRLATRLQNSMDASIMGTQSVQEIMSSWNSRAQELLRLYRVTVRDQVQQRLESVRAQASAQAHKDLARVEEEFRAEMEKLVGNRSVDEQTFNLKATTVQNQLATKLQNSMDVSTMGSQCVQAIMSSWSSRAQELLRQYKKTVRDQVQQRLETARAQAYQTLARAEQKFREETQRILDGGTDERKFDRETIALQNRLRRELENSMDTSNMSQQCVRDIMSAWDSKTEAILHHYSALLRRQLEQEAEKARAKALESLAQARVEPGCSREVNVHVRAPTRRRTREKKSTLASTVKKYSWLGGLAGMAVASFLPSDSESEYNSDASE